VQCRIGVAAMQTSLGSPYKAGIGLSSRSKLLLPLPPPCSATSRVSVIFVYIGNVTACPHATDVSQMMSTNNAPPHSQARKRPLLLGATHRHAYDATSAAVNGLRSQRTEWLTQPYFTSSNSPLSTSTVNHQPQSSSIIQHIMMV
jgi:hypothetical protein